VSDFAAFLDYDALASRSDDYTPPYVASMFDEQRAAYEDQSKNKTYLCTRRSGKTVADAVDAYETSKQCPGGETLVLSTTRGHVRTTVGNALERLIADYGLPLRAKTIDGRFFYQNTETKHRIWMSGCKDFREAEKLRGDWLNKVIIDECQSFSVIPDMSKDDGTGRGKFLLEYLVEDVLSPRLMDKAGGMVLSGSPGVVLRGYWYEITTGKGVKLKWPTHQWSLLQNPYMTNVRAELAERMRIFGWTEASATYRREWLGQWVEDSDALIYRYNAQLNGLNWGPFPGCIEVAKRELGPDLFWGLGVDLGHRDATAFVLAVAPKGKPGFYVLRCWGGSELSVPNRAAEIHRVEQVLRDAGQRLDACVMDTGGGGAMIAHDLRTNFGLSIEAATKPEKAAGIRLVQGDLLRGHVKVNVGESGHLLGEWSVLPWDDAMANHHDSYPDHWSDACVYIRRRMPTYESWVKELPALGSPEHVEIERAKLKTNMARMNNLRIRLARATSLAERSDIQRQLREFSH
jgi:hypothetical protein